MTQLPSNVEEGGRGYDGNDTGNTNSPVEIQ